MRIAAYLGWALETSGYGGPAVERARQFIDGHMGAKADAYTLAVLANFAVDYGKDREFTRRAMQLLLDARTYKDDKTWWSADETGVYGTGESATVETTGLADPAPVLHTIMVQHPNGKIYIGAQNCSNQPSIPNSGCLSVYTPSANTATVDQARGNVTGIQPVNAKGRNVTYVTVGGQFLIYDGATDQPQTNQIPLTGQITDVKSAQ